MEQHRQPLAPDVSWARRLPRTRIKVVSAEAMDGGTFLMHIEKRHPELRDGTATTPSQHILAHMLIPNVLDHWHEVPEP
jgi:hypothetical protein